MRIKSEADILKPEVRRQIIEEIEGPENKRRKYEHYRRQLCFKDQTPMFVTANLVRQFDAQTVREMQYAVSNISIVRKIIGKLARVYDANVSRQVMINDQKNEEAKASIEALEKYFSFNSIMQTLNRMVRLHMQSLLYVKPCPNLDAESDEGSMELSLQVLTPYLYDAVENHYDRTEAMCYILSNYEPHALDYSIADAGQHGPIQSQLQTPQGLMRPGNNRDELIADKKEDEGTDKKEYIWWSDSYHFTTNAMGEIVSDTDSGTDNPIKEMPLINFAMDQDNSFWAVGGDDLSMGAILINSMLTHINHIGITQGYGQFYMTGKDIPKNLKIGPNKGVCLEYTKDDPVPSIGFASANPQLNELKALVEMQTALLLTTNNLSTSGVKTQLGSQASASSGIALLIDKSESLEDVNDQRTTYINNEPCVWEIISKWQAFYGDQLGEELKSSTIPDGANVVPSFGQQPMIETESERLDIILKRKDLGLNTRVELLKIDQPELTDDEAEQKLAEIDAERQDRMNAMAMMGEPGRPGKYNPQSIENTTGQPNDSLAGGAPNGNQGPQNQGDKGKPINGNGSIQ